MVITKPCLGLLHSLLSLVPALISPLDYSRNFLAHFSDISFSPILLPANRILSLKHHFDTVSSLFKSLFTFCISYPSKGTSIHQWPVPETWMPSLPFLIPSPSHTITKFFVLSSKYSLNQFTTNFLHLQSSCQSPGHCCLWSGLPQQLPDWCS